MNSFIFYSGIAAFIFLTLTVFLKVFKKKQSWHVRLGYITFVLALIHGGLAIYKSIRLYLLYS